ncbi:DEAD/DEAH box helicase [Nocardia sp. NEAU-G5]|uniref:DEAD/DEAH box helicase n=1 Tax=Nocardia albiluteola TaxID=2842303 RepID=A0ABS6AUP3_9NOCA|nr:DEAD/DEAH box helicase [Nocardia albiluteola]MBU3061745.1 DEAD/DEAH box helicase [Nocardia albiluteola]
MLHGLWTPGSGLVLWQHPESDVVAAIDAVAVPDPLGAVVQAARFRHRAQVVVAGPDGPRTLEVKAHALAPQAAAPVLLQPLPPGAVAADLRFLGHAARGVERWVRAGRIVPELRRDDGDWWVRWRLVGGQRQRAWLAELAAAMPPALRAAGRGAAVLEDLVTELADPIAHLWIDARSVGVGRAADPHPLIGALISGAALDSGSHRVASALQEWRTSLTSGEPELVLRLIEPDDDPEQGAETLAALWRLQVCLRSEGEAPQPVPLQGDPAQLRLAGERVTAAIAAYPMLQRLPRDPGGIDFLLPTEVVLDLVAHGANELRSAGVHLLLPRAWQIVAPSMRMQVQSPAATESTVGMDGLVSYRWELALGDVVLTPAEMSRLVQSKSDLVRLRGEWVQADHRALAAAAQYLDGRTDETIGSLTQLLAEIAASEVRQVPIEDVTATGWVAELLAADRDAAQVDPPAGLKAELRPYQLRGLSWLATMNRLGCGGILADDMGLGKTVQVLALLVHERETATVNPVPLAAAQDVTGAAGSDQPDADGSPAGSRLDATAPASDSDQAEGPGVASNAANRHIGPTLLVAPMSVVGNWQREAERFAPGLRVMVHHGAGRRSGADFDAAVADSDLVITTYALLARDIEELKRQHWQRVVLDEAQHIKNSATRQSRAARAVPARHRLALTGTPVENRLEELRSILDFAAPSLLGKASQFHARFAVPIERERDANALTRLRTVTSPFVLRRVKTDPAVISDLPDKIEMTVRANLTVEQAALYQAVVDDMLAKLKDAEGMSRKGAVLGALTRLKQVCNHPAHYLGDGSGVLRRGQHRSGKLGLVEDVLESVLADGEKALLFTQFREFGELIAPYLTERFGVPIPFLHGGVSKKGRDAMVERFQESGGPPLMLLSLKAGGTGLNLTAANHVVHLDRWWNPAVENQATDRAFRIGQRRDVQVRKLVCVDTIEERIDDMISGKQELADMTVGTGENWITELSTEEIGTLFALGAEAVGE